MMIIAIKNKDDFDFGYPEETKEEFRAWDKYKEEMFADTLLQQQGYIDPNFLYKKF